MKVAFISHSADLYGAERSLLDLVINLPDRYAGSLVVLPRSGPLSEILHEHGIECIVVPYRGWVSYSFRLVIGLLYNPVFNAIAAIRLARVLKGLDIDFVYTNTLYSPVGAILSRILRVPHIWHFREFVYEDMGARFDIGFNPAVAFCDSFSEAIIFNSHAVSTKYSSYIKNSKKSVVYNGVVKEERLHDLYIPRESIAKNTSVRLCMVGGISAKKGQEDAIRALGILLQEDARFTLTIAGNGDSKYIESLKKLSNQLCVADRIEWLGFIEKSSSLFQEVDIALMCSRQEAFGRVIVEAMLEGCPVVATNSGGVSEIIDHEQDGMLYQCRDARDLANQIILLKNDDALYQKISMAGFIKSRVEFTLGRYVNEVCSIIDECIM